MKRRTFRLRWWIALGIAIVAILAPTAQARPLSDQNGRALPVERHVDKSRTVAKSDDSSWSIAWIALGSAAAVSLLGAAAVGRRSGRLVWNIR